MHNKVMIVSADFFGYHHSIAAAFQQRGYDTKVVTYDEPIHPFRGINKWRHKFSTATAKQKLKENSRINFSQSLKDDFDQFKPSIVFILNGTQVTDQVLDYFREKRAKVILWMYDSIFRSNREMCIPHIDHVDLFLCFEQADVDYFTAQDKKAFFLPLAYDPHVFFPIDNQNKDIDILFVGTIYISPKRIRILRMLIDAFPDKKIQIYGHYKPFYKNILKWLFREKRNIFKNRNISPKKVNELFSRTKIALNIHQSQTINGANPRLFEAAGAGVYQISDYNEYIRTLFSNGEIGFYDNDQQLIQCIEEALNNDNSAAALNARHLVEKQHTFLNRIDYVLQLLNNADTL